ncbi:MAG: rhodanese-like domain-containing protein [Halothece sp. Uz-M2-17]|nr:rhodanese-like domain-containing protein [Halothece sp. Uz-M2-17]
MADTPFQHISVEELALALETKGSDRIQLIDVREPQEVETAAISGFTNLPLSQYEQWAPQIHQHFDPEKETLVMCHHGVRSAQMCYWLNQQGFSNVKNIIGGIDAYSLAIDSSIPRY